MKTKPSASDTGVFPFVLTLQNARRSCVWIALLVLVPTAFAIEIKTRTSKLTLDPIPTLTTDNALRQNLLIAERGMGELKAETASLAEEQKQLDQEDAKLKEKQKSEQALVDQLDARFAEAYGQYNSKLSAYQQRLRIHDADAAKQNAAAAASNALPAQHRNPATVSQVNDWGQRVDASKTRLDQEKSLLDQERELVESKRTEVLAYQEGATERLKAMEAALEAKKKAFRFKKELAYRQLRQCAEYAQKIRNRLETDFKQPQPFSVILDDTLDQLKKESTKGFDTP